MKYHINPQTGKPNQCRAKSPQSCKFYNAESDTPAPHFDSKEQAQKAYESQRESDMLANTVSSPVAPEIRTTPHAVKHFGDIDDRIIHVARGQNMDAPFVTQDYDEMDDMGVRVATVEGAGFCGMGYDVHQVSGVLNYHALDEDSYQRFGFKSPDRMRDSLSSFNGHMANTMFFGEGEGQIIKTESDLLSDSDKYFTRSYSSDSYWINNGLYRDCKTSEDYTGEYNPLLNSKMTCLDSRGEKFQQKTDTINETLHQGLCRGLDVATNKGIGLQRTVYRGIGSSNVRTSDGTVVNDCELGQELKFDGFTSTTLNPSVAFMFNNRDTVPTILEIKSGSGVALNSDIGINDYEAEVLLPRGSRFVVVGKQTVAKQLLKSDEIQNPEAKVNVVQLVEINEEGEIVDHHNINKANAMRFQENKRIGKVPWDVDLHDDGSWS